MLRNRPTRKAIRALGQARASTTPPTATLAQPKLPATQRTKATATTSAAPQTRPVPIPAFNLESESRRHVQPLVNRSKPEMDESFIGKTGGEIFHEMMLRHGVKHIFGYPGGAILPVFDAIYNSKHFDFILPRHEQGAGHMAQATNIITPMQDALSDGTPIVVFTGQVVTSAIGLDAFQDWDLRKAIPTQTCLPSLPSIASQAAKRLMEKQLSTSLGHAAELIKVAKQPIIYAGQGIIQSKGGTELLRELADKCSIPVTTTLQGLGAFDERDEKSLHMLGMHGMAYANMSMQEADLIIALGARFDDRVVLNTSKFAPNAKAAAIEKRGGIIHFDILPKNINKVIQATEAIEGDVATNLKMLIPMLTSISMEQRSEWFNKISEWKAKWPLSNYERADSPGGNGLIKPQSLIEELSDLTSKIDKKTIISTGVGQHQMWVAQHYSWREPRSFVTSGGLGTMGFGLPSAIGIAVARPDALVIDVDGDASFNMTLTELSTAAQFNIGVKVIILNNEEQGMVTQWQNLFYEDRYAHTHQRNPDFVKLADAMGVQARKVSKPEDVRASLEWLINTDGPALLEVITDKKVPLLPMVPAGAGLHEFLVYDREKDKARRQLMRERTNGLHGS
ncbi:hypothetical protein CIB48_g6228 [Xylaria polymorpha]|nr:hypothetical protein CIB48_g6228 [Xylaria polymorpha]